VNGIAAPVADHSGDVVAAIVISGPSERLQSARLHQMLPLLLEAARSISTELGFRGQLPGWQETVPTRQVPQIGTN
jgi:DNA-binding IclR family transcriptional regulator